MKQPMSDDSGQVLSPAAFGRLCVETFMPMLLINFLMPAAFGRLCVETDCVAMISPFPGPSRLRAAVC